MSETAPYTTRAVVYRPINPAKFNGTVVVEWLNVSGGLDDAPDWTLAHNELVREGLSGRGLRAGCRREPAQVPRSTSASCDVRGSRQSDACYASLSHPGDSFSYDMYSQAGQAIRDDARQMWAG